MATTETAAAEALPREVAVPAPPARARAVKSWVWVVIAVAFVVPLLKYVVPDVISDYRLFVMSTMMIAGIAVLGLNLLTGFNGQISLGHGAFYAVGAYTAAILMDKVAWPDFLGGGTFPYWLAVIVSAFVCFCVGYLFGQPALKLEGHYLALATFALALAVPQFLKYRWLEDLTGGVQGIVLLKPQPPCLDHFFSDSPTLCLPLSEDQWLYYYVLIVMVGLYFVAFNILRGRVGCDDYDWRPHHGGRHHGHQHGPALP